MSYLPTQPRYYYMLNETQFTAKLMSFLLITIFVDLVVEAAAIVRDIVEAIAFLHQNEIAHRDLKVGWTVNALCDSVI